MTAWQIPIVCIIGASISGCAESDNLVSRPDGFTDHDSYRLELKAFDSGSQNIDDIVVRLVSLRAAPFPSGYPDLPIDAIITNKFATDAVLEALVELRALDPKEYIHLVQHLRDERYSYSIAVAGWINISVGDAVVAVLADGAESFSGYKSRKTPSGTVPYLSFRDYLFDLDPESWAETAATLTKPEIKRRFIEWCIDTETKRGFLSAAQEAQVLAPYLAALKEN